MNGILLLIIAVAVVILAYFTYGKFISRLLKINNKQITPAHSKNDKIDYVPAKTPVLFGHHFASIAGAGPIVGPIIALVYGWLPVYLWILIGVVFIGAVHDFSSLFVSIRNDGKSIGKIVEKNIGLVGKRLFLLFSWSSLVLVISVFLDIVAKTFAHNPSVASASILFIFIAVIFGVGLYKFKLKLGLLSIVAIIFLFFCMYLGIKYPVSASENTWMFVLLIYIFLASILPVWILLQPRDYINSFLLYALMIGAIFGIFFYNPHLQIETFSGFYNEKLGSLFPILFITVACGAISGFHSLVASGTTAKQLNKEKDAKIIGFGGMLLEGVLAVVAIIAAASLSQTEYLSLFSGGKFISIFASGIANFIASIPFLNISIESGKTFAAMAISAFALTSLDTATRLSRFAFQEFFEFKETKHKKVFLIFQNRYTATTVTVFAGAILLMSGGSTKIWPLFGSANQLLAATALLAVSVWLSNKNIKNLFILIPMLFMYIVTITALIILIYKNLFIANNIVLAIISVILLALSFILLYKSYAKLRK